MLCTNHLPWIKNVDGGILRRLLLIPFQAKISACEDIKNYADYLYKNAGSFILKWVIEGAQKVIALNYKIQAPKVVRDAFNTHYGNTTWLDQFVTDCCVVGKTLSEKSGALYKAYQNYCSENGELSRSTRDFYSTIEAKGYFKNRTSKGVIVHGLSVKENQNF